MSISSAQNCSICDIFDMNVVVFCIFHFFGKLSWSSLFVMRNCLASLSLNLFVLLLFLLEWFAFIGQKAPPGFPGSPYAINFKLSIPESSGLELMNVSTYSCGDTSLGCSCGDCPLSPMCSSSEPPSPPRKEACTIRIGSLKVGNDADITINFLLAFLLLMVDWLALISQC